VLVALLARTRIGAAAVGEERSAPAPPRRLDVSPRPGGA
jgi:hypothetical protein